METVYPVVQSDAPKSIGERKFQIRKPQYVESTGKEMGKYTVPSSRRVTKKTVDADTVEREVQSEPKREKSRTVQVRSDAD